MLEYAATVAAYAWSPARFSFSMPFQLHDSKVWDVWLKSSVA